MAEPPVAAFLDHLLVERGLSPHTVAAYRRDLQAVAGWLAASGRQDLAGCSSADPACGEAGRSS